jgi:hypothetical protein
MPPQIVSEMKNYTAYVGDNVTLECRVMSTYPPFIQWVKHYQVNGSLTGENKSQNARIVSHTPLTPHAQWATRPSRLM